MSIEMDTAVEYLYPSDTEVDGDQTKCGEIFVSFSSFEYEFVCILCKERKKYHDFKDYVDHVREEHVFCGEEQQPESPDDELTAKNLQEEENSDNSDMLAGNEDFPPDVEMLDFTDDDSQCADELEVSSSSYRECMTELLDMYRKCIGLWHRKTAQNTSNDVKSAALGLLLEKYTTHYPHRSLNDLQNRLDNMKKCFIADTETSAGSHKQWYFKYLAFLRFAEEDEVPDSEFEDFSCPCCKCMVAGSTRARDLWVHIITNHINVERRDLLTGEQTKIFTLQWPEESILQLIDLYREQECLWNVKSRLYHNRSLKADAYKTIIETYNEHNPNLLKDRDAVREAIKHLRDYFGRVDKKFRTSTRRGVYLPLNKYKIYKKLLFLKDVYMPRRTPPTSACSCELCGKSFTKRKDLNAHTKTEHADAVFTCDKCPLTFKSQLNIETHRREHLKSDGRTYACPICHLNFENSEELATHLNEHLPRNLQKQICDICGAKFDDRSNLLIHIRRHTNTKNYVCDVCHKGFVTSTELKSHVVVHSNDRPFVCEICGLRFKYSNRLNTHQLFHGEPKFNCMACDMKFVTKRHLTEHQRIHTPPNSHVEKINCNICGNLFRNADSLSRHERKIHNIKKREQDRFGRMFKVVSSTEADHT